MSYINSLEEAVNCVWCARAIENHLDEDIDLSSRFSNLQAFKRDNRLWAVVSFLFYLYGCSRIFLYTPFFIAWYFHPIEPQIRYSHLGMSDFLKKLTASCGRFFPSVIASAAILRALI